MLLLLTVWLLTSGALTAPIPNAQPRSANISDQCQDLRGCRSIYGIVLTCLTTIWICTWVAVHPNLPQYVERRKHSEVSWRYWLRVSRSFARQKLLLFVITLLFPEFVLAWARRQWAMARYIRNHETVNGQRITMDGAFFMIMGGFHSSQTDQDSISHPLHWKEVIEIHNSRKINLPKAHELQDRSKIDALARLLCILQILWFFLQCIVRHSLHLHLTQLEKLTMAHVIVNIFLFFLWWYKPQRVEYPLEIPVQPTGSPDEGYIPLRGISDVSLETFSVLSGTTMIASSVDDTEPFIKTPTSELFAHRISHMIFGLQDNVTDLKSMTAVPMFYSGNPPKEEKSWTFFTTLIASLAFPFFQAQGDNYPFPTTAETAIWKASTGVMIAMIICMAAIVFLFWRQELCHKPKRQLEKKVHNAVGPIYNTIVPYILCAFYVAARICSIVVAFTVFRHLPLKLYQTPYWTSLIPHI